MTDETQTQPTEYKNIREEKSAWFLEIKERAKNLPRGSVEHYAPAVAAQALWMLAQGARIKSISEKTGLGHETIRKLEWRHNDTLETKRKEFSMRYAIAAQEYTDLLFEKAEQLSNDSEALSKISPDKLALTIGIMTDKAAQLTGMAGIVIEHRKGASIDDAMKMIAETKARIAERIKSQAIEAEIIEE
jgi:hypothetical protein